MHFIRESNRAANIVTAYGPGEVRVGERSLRGAAIVTADTIVEDWAPGEAAALTRAHLERVLALEPEVILLGTGERLSFPDRALVIWVTGLGIGFEVMDSAAACRTYNVLVNEQRRVAVALLAPV